MEIRRTKILGFMLLLAGIILCGTGLWLLFSPAQYRATARIEIDPEAADVSINGQVSYNPYFIQTEFEIIQSPLVLSDVVESLGLNIEWGKKYGDGSPLKTEQAIWRLKRRMNLQPVRNTKLIKISFFSEDPHEAARIANAIARAYRDYRIKKSEQIIVLGIQALEESYLKEESDIKSKQESLERLKKELNLPNPEPAEGLLKSNYPAYFQARQELQKTMDLHKLLDDRIVSEKLIVSEKNYFVKTSPVQIIDTAEPPKFPVSPNRWLGAALLAIGLFPTVGGFLLLKSSRLQSA